MRRIVFAAAAFAAALAAAAPANAFAVVDPWRAAT